MFLPSKGDNQQREECAIRIGNQLLALAKRTPSVLASDLLRELNSQLEQQQLSAIWVNTRLFAHSFALHGDFSSLHARLRTHTVPEAITQESFIAPLCDLLNNALRDSE